MSKTVRKESPQQRKATEVGVRRPGPGAAWEAGARRERWRKDRFQKRSAAPVPGTLNVVGGLNRGGRARTRRKEVIGGTHSVLYMRCWAPAWANLRFGPT